MTVIPPSPPVAIPLTPEVRAAYQQLYDTNETLLQNTADPGFLQALNDVRTNVGNILTKDDLYQLESNTLLFEALRTQIKSTNVDLANLKKQIQAVASHVAEAAALIGGIEKVLSLVGV